MIVEQLANWRDLFSGPVWERSFQALEALDSGAPEGRVDLQGEDGGELNLRVMEYATRPVDSCVLEAHREFLDIHVVLRGAERIDWFPVSALKVKAAYDDGRDVVFFDRPVEAPASVTLRPGMFAVMFPGDAHMPQMIVDGEPAPLRKAVVKIRARLVARQG